MHACGRDGHATIGLGLAEMAAREPRNWSGTLRLVFQPAEEGGRGAWPTCAGVVDDVDLFLALHLGCDLSSRKVAVSASDMMFSAKWDVHFEGRSAHASGNPEEGRNALLAAARATTLLYALPRHGRFATQVNVGRLNAGSARNIIANWQAWKLRFAEAPRRLSNTWKRAKRVRRNCACAGLRDDNWGDGADHRRAEQRESHGPRASRGGSMVFSTRCSIPGRLAAEMTRLISCDA